MDKRGVYLSANGAECEKCQQILYYEPNAEKKLPNDSPRCDKKRDPCESRWSPLTIPRGRDINKDTGIGVIQRLLTMCLGTSSECAVDV